MPKARATDPTVYYRTPAQLPTTPAILNREGCAAAAHHPALADPRRLLPRTRPLGPLPTSAAPPPRQQISLYVFSDSDLYRFSDSDLAVPSPTGASPLPAPMHETAAGDAIDSLFPPILAPPHDAAASLRPHSNQPRAAAAAAARLAGELGGRGAQGVPRGALGRSPGGRGRGPRPRGGRAGLGARAGPPPRAARAPAPPGRPPARAPPPAPPPPLPAPPRRPRPARRAAVAGPSAPPSHRPRRPYGAAALMAWHRAEPNAGPAPGYGPGPGTSRHGRSYRQ